MGLLCWRSVRSHLWLRSLITLVLGGFMGLGILLATLESAIAAPTPVDLTRQPPIEVNVHLGNAANELKFFPNTMNFVAGQRYKLVLDNPSATKHYFTAKDFADSIWTQKIEAGQVEVKGAIHEVELKPGAIADWVFVPIKPGNYELHCTIPGHAEAGMVGRLTVTAQ